MVFGMCYHGIVVQNSYPKIETSYRSETLLRDGKAVFLEVHVRQVVIATAARVTCKFESKSNSEQ